MHSRTQPRLRRARARATRSLVLFGSVRNPRVNRSTASAYAPRSDASDPPASADAASSGTTSEAPSRERSFEAAASPSPLAPYFSVSAAFSSPSARGAFERRHGRRSASRPSRRSMIPRRSAARSGG
jgi:hypothetical protein